MKNKLTTTQLLVLLISLLCLLLSFRLYAYPYFPLLNSDHALAVLHIHFWEWPRDFYPYGQDRMGNLIPLLARPLYLWGVPLLWSEALIHYSIHIMGFVAWISFLKKPLAKIIFAIWWFLPNYHLLNLIDVSFGTMLALLGMAFYLYTLYLKNGNKWAFALYFFILFLAVWVNDFAVFYALSLGLVGFVDCYRKDKRKSYSILAAHVAGGLLIGGLIYYFKKKAKSEVVYGGMVSPTEFLHMLADFFHSLIKIAGINSGNIFESLFTLGGVIIFVYTCIKLSSKEHRDFFVYTLILSSILILAAVFSSEFTLWNGLPRRYFVVPFFNLCILFLYIWGRDRKSVQWIGFFALFIVLMGAVSGVWGMRYIYPKTLKPKAQIISELAPSHRIALMGNYWHAYIFGVVYPDKIAVTVHEKDLIRSWDMVEEVKQFDTLYVNGEWWLEEFPDSLVQYGQRYYKYGDSFNISDSQFNLYIKEH